MNFSDLEKEYLRTQKSIDEDSIDPKLSIKKVLEKIEDGDWVIPDFQRDFVWNIERFVLLFDSIYRGYTIGNILLWETNEKLAHKRIGQKEAIPLEKVKQKEYNYILDGQQRLTTLYGVLKRKELHKSGRKKPKIYIVYFDLKKNEFISEDKKLEEFNNKSLKDLFNADNANKFRFINLSDLFDKEFNFPDNLVNSDKEDNQKDFSNNIITKEKYQERRDELEKIEKPLRRFKFIFENYKIHQNIEKNKKLDEVVTVFERINTQNVKLDIFDIMVAKTYENILFNKTKHTFNLRNYVPKLLYKKELKKEQRNPSKILAKDDSLYYNIDYTTVLRLLSTHINSSKKIAVEKENIYGLSAQEIQDNLLSMRSILEDIHRYLKKELNIKDVNIRFTDNKILTFLTYIFSQEKYSLISSSDIKMVNKWFWNSTIFNRFPGAQLQKLSEDLREFGRGAKLFYKHISKNRNFFIYADNFKLRVNSKETSLIDAGYTKQNNLYLSLIRLLNSLKPEDFNGKGEINISDYIGERTKNNKHHIIPYNSDAAKKIRKKYSDDKYVDFLLNNISNICIISRELNQKIKKKDPRNYLAEFEKNQNFLEIMENHLIDGEMIEFLKTEKYEEFLIKRTNKIVDKIKLKCEILKEKIPLSFAEEEFEEEE